MDLVSRFIEVLLPWQLIADYQLIFHPLLKIVTLLLSKRRASAGPQQCEDFSGNRLDHCWLTKISRSKSVVQFEASASRRSRRWA